jgi:hypothetical protein
MFRIPVAGRATLAAAWTALSLQAGLLGRAAGDTASPLENQGVQRCNTGCQSRFTDCILRCDGGATCEAACRTTVDTCVKGCGPGPATASLTEAPGAKRECVR